jgi:Asp/Glu/hydantoin racemase
MGATEPLSSTESQTIVVINPNSSTSVTQGIDRALDALRIPGGPSIECSTLEEGPEGIETDAQVEAVVAPLCRRIQARSDDAAAFVIACFSDPGLQRARTSTRRPVFGIGECSMLAALTRGRQFGILSILEASLPRHQRAIQAAGLRSRFAGDRPIGLGVAELSKDGVLDRLTEVGETLRDQDGADVVILGCAGMARYRKELEHSLELPVIDPTQAAVTMAIGAVRLS